MERHRIGQVVLVIAGLGLLGMASTGGSEAQYTLSITDSGAQPPEDAPVVAFEALSPAVQDRFQQALSDGDASITADMSETLGAYSYIEYQGTFYEYAVYVGDSNNTGGVFLLGGLGVGVLIAGLGWAIRSS